MRKKLWIGMAILAASALLPSAAWSQATTPPPAPPAPPARRAQAAILTTGSSYLGIGVVDIDAERAKALNLKEVRGAEITHVAENTPASKAGFKEGDVVWEYNGQTVEGREQLTRLIQETPPGRQVKVVIWRNGAMMTLTPTVEARKGMTMEPRTWVMPDVRIPEFNIPEIPQFDYNVYRNPMLGITGEALGREEQLAEFFGVKDGVLVKSVGKNSAAEKAGIKAGDVVVKVDDTKVSTTRDITSALRAARSKKTVTVVVMRNRKEVPLSVTVESAGTPGAVRAGWIWGPRVIVGPTVEIDPAVVIGPQVIVRPSVVLPRIVIPAVRLQFPRNHGVI